MTQTVFVWGTITTKYGETYKLNEPKMLINEENSSEKERRYLKIECSSEDIYFLDSI